VSPLTSGRLSHSSEPLNGGASLTGTDSPPISPSDEFDDVVKVSLCSFPLSFSPRWGPHKYNNIFVTILCLLSLVLFPISLLNAAVSCFLKPCYLCNNAFQ